MNLRAKKSEQKREQIGVKIKADLFSAIDRIAERQSWSRSHVVEELVATHPKIIGELKNSVQKQAA